VAAWLDRQLHKLTRSFDSAFEQTLPVVDLVLEAGHRVRLPLALELERLQDAGP
jgi:hypothetical protein